VRAGLMPDGGLLLILGSDAREPAVEW
jgi:hypothetical protein